MRWYDPTVAVRRVTICVSHPIFVKFRQGVPLVRPFFVLFTAVDLCNFM